MERDAAMMAPLLVGGKPPRPQPKMGTIVIVLCGEGKGKRGEEKREEGKKKERKRKEKGREEEERERKEGKKERKETFELCFEHPAKGNKTE